MSAAPQTRPRIVTSTRLYATSVFAIGMAIPHFAVGIAAHWPGQLMSGHVLVIVLLLFAGRSTELAEARTSPRRVASNTSDEFDDITQKLRDLDR